MRYNTSAIRDLLNEALSDEEITTLCFDHFREIYDTYFTPSLNRQQKTQILLEQVERRGELDRLLALVREINPTRVTAYADQVLRLPSAPARRNRRRWVLFLGAGLIVLALGGLWLVNRLRSPTLPPLPKVITCQASLDPVRVGMQELKGCPGDLAAGLNAAWTAAGATLTPIAGGTAPPLRSLRQPDGYDLVVSGACQADAAPAALDLTFALSSIRNPDELYQPPEIKLRVPVEDAAPFGSALIAFQRGEYDRAAQQLSALPAEARTRELALLAASALLFEQRYEDAIEALSELTRQHQDWSAAVNNLGVARFNQALLGDFAGYATAGEDYLSKAIELATDQRESDIEFLAHVNRANVHSQVENIDKVAADCQQAEKLDGQSPLVRVCWLYYYLTMYHGKTAETMTYKARVVGYLGTPRDDDLPRLVFMRGDWYRSQKRAEEAGAAFTAFLRQMQFHACLAEDRKAIKQIPGQSESFSP
jgi:tetratricopeptide (TPR) repeat protein